MGTVTTNNQNLRSCIRRNTQVTRLLTVITVIVGLVLTGSVSIAQQHPVK